MLVVIPTHSGDIERAIELMRWIRRLGECLAHNLLITADAGTPHVKIQELRDLAFPIFREVRITSNGAPVKGWPDGCYSLFRATTAYVISKWPQPFLILEPDAVPLCPGWLDRIAATYTSGFLGQIYDGEGRFAGGKFMSGIAVYPADTETRLTPRGNSVHWDVEYAGEMVSQGSHTPLIKHYFGSLETAPTFAAEMAPERYTYTLDWLGDAVLFHRNKDGSLIRLLRRKFFNERTRQNIAVVFPVCARDIHTAVKHSDWLWRMNNGLSQWQHEAVIAFDRDTPVVLVNQMESNLRRCFAKVSVFDYHRAPFQQYPHAANWAFQNTAHHMAKQDRSWLWMEADAVALRPNWLDVLQEQYENCGRDWYGPIVPHMGHLQGTSIYPPDTATRMLGAMHSVEQAFDMMSRDIVHLAADAHPYMFHMWTLLNRQPCPVGGGEVPAGITGGELRSWLPKEAVFLHRIKDHSVLDLLIGGFRP